MLKYQTTVREVTAIRFTGDPSLFASFAEMDKFFIRKGKLYIRTPNGKMKVKAGDYIVKDKGGNYTVWRKDLFDEAFEIVGEQHE